jgi:L-threonylcarbamoyladenylate synthase
VLEDLDGRIDAVLDGGATVVGVESTVLEPNESPMILYRPGAVTAEMLEPVGGPVVLYEAPPRSEAEPQSLPSPGVGIRHYAPRARLVLAADEDELHMRLKELMTGKERVGVMLPQGWAAPDGKIEVFRWNSFDDNAGLAHSLFAGLRELDGRGVGVILCPLPGTDGLGLALRDRLEKASKTK